jgi:hypothetical protein
MNIAEGRRELAWRKKGRPRFERGKRRELNWFPVLRRFDSVARAR